MGAALKLTDDELGIDEPAIESALADAIEQAAEVLEDFPTACSLLNIKPKAVDGEPGGLIPFHYEDWNDEQRQFEAERTGWDLILKPRQVGFTTQELARDLIFAATRIGVDVVVVVHEKEAAAKLRLVIKTMLDGLAAAGLAPTTSYDNVREFVFADLKSSIRVFEAGATDDAAKKKGRSGTIHRLHVTELAFWGAAQTTMSALLGCVPIGGEVVIESTPKGAVGTFYELVQTAKEGRGPYKLHFFPWYRHVEYTLPVGEDFDPTPRDRWEELLRSKGCNDGQLAWWRSKVEDKNIGLETALEEWPIDEETCFRVGGGHYIAATAIDEMSPRVRAPKRLETSLRWKRPSSGSNGNGSNGHAGREKVLDIEIRTFADPVAARRYVIGVDPSEGMGGDGSAIQVLEWDTGETVCVAWSEHIAAGDLGLACDVIGRRYNSAIVAIERNNHGHAALHALESEAEYPDAKIYRAGDHKRGWHTNTATRPVLFDDLRLAIEDGDVWTPDTATLGETRTIVKDPADGKPRAHNKGLAGGAKDDRFVAWGIAWQVRSKPLAGQRMWDAMAKVRAARLASSTPTTNAVNGADE